MAVFQVCDTTLNTNNNSKTYSYYSKSKQKNKQKNYSQCDITIVVKKLDTLGGGFVSYKWIKQQRLLLV